MLENFTFEETAPNDTDDIICCYFTSKKPLTDDDKNLFQTLTGTSFQKSCNNAGVNPNTVACLTLAAEINKTTKQVESLTISPTADFGDSLSDFDICTITNKRSDIITWLKTFRSITKNDTNVPTILDDILDDSDNE